jgi:hypothetical protein
MTICLHFRMRLNLSAIISKPIVIFLLYERVLAIHIQYIRFYW